MSITRYLAKNVLNYSKKNSIRWKIRRKRLLPLLSLIESVYQHYGQVRIIDVGGTRNYWKLVSDSIFREKNIHVTIVNVPGSPMPKGEEFFSFVEADGCGLYGYEDKSFNIAHSNSVIEHVGDWDRMVKFAGEISRVAEKYFVQTPSYWFPIEPHCMTPIFHWLPKPLRVLLVLHFNLGHWCKQDTVDMAVRTVESARLLDKNMVGALFKDAEIRTERYFFFPKSYIVIKSH